MAVRGLIRAVDVAIRSDAEADAHAEADGGPVGFVAVRWTQEDATPVGEVDMIAVDPRHQRVGIAGRLLDRALAEIAARGVPLALIGTGCDDGHAPPRASTRGHGSTGLPLVKLYADESGHERVRGLSGLVVSQLPRVEVPSAIWRKQRLGELGPDSARLLTAAFEADWSGSEDELPRFTAVPPTVAVLDEAARLGAVHGIRAHDAVQLASALGAPAAPVHRPQPAGGVRR